jgi:hypothetical protein
MHCGVLPAIFSGAIQMVDRRFGWWRACARRIERAVVAAIVTAVVMFVAGCATTGGNLTKDTPVESKQAVVRERAEARWQAIIKGDYAAAYSYFSPASREIVNLGTFEARSKAIVKYTGIKIDTVSCEAAACKVKLFLTYDHKVMKGVTTPVEEAWIIDGGQLWYVWPG